MMNQLSALLFAYVLGGLTFLPLLVIAVVIHAYFTFPVRSSDSTELQKDGLLRAGDDVDIIKADSKELEEKFRVPKGHDPDGIAGYFAVCREFVPGGINGKPPERITPTGATSITSPSPSVYQSMYRSIFERKKDGNNPLEHKNGAKPPSKSGNVFYVVLRHQHLLLFDTEEQLEVRYVLSLVHHNVSIYGGGEEIPEGELFIKRNAICLSRKSDSPGPVSDVVDTKPFYLFTDNLSAKEDFYFALLKNVEANKTSLDQAPVPLQFEVKHIIDLVQRLHSSEEHMQVRWFNAMLGRLFLAIYRTPEVEDVMRAKITKKISRVKKPAFLSHIRLRKVDMGEGAPYLTNPRLKDFTVDGDCTIEGDMLYTGNVRVEIAATARIELGSRFKPREVDLVLAVTCRKIEGHMLFRFKPPPSNRLWMTFEKPPQIEMAIEPIVSSRQITYGLILRQIESRIKEVIAESIVMPFWDDIAFFPTEGKPWRGGIWAQPKSSSPSEPITSEDVLAEEGDVDEFEKLDSEANETQPTPLSPNSKSMSMPILDTSRSPPPNFAKKAAKSVFKFGGSIANDSSSSVDAGSSSTSTATPRAIRKNSFASAVVSTDSVNVDALKSENNSEQSSAATIMAEISARSPPQSANSTPFGSPAKESYRHKHSMSSPSTSGSQASHSFGQSASISGGSLDTRSVKDGLTGGSSTEGVYTHDSSATGNDSSHVSPGTAETSTVRQAPAHITRKSNGSIDTIDSSESGSSTGKTAATKKAALTAMATAAANARKWGINAFNKSGEQLKRQSGNLEDIKLGLSQPMGRGMPLPPPGTPLPKPDRITPTAPIPVPKRKPVPHTNNTQPGHDSKAYTKVPSDGYDHPPPPPKRRQKTSQVHEPVDSDGIFVIAAPQSEPPSPLSISDGANAAYFPPRVEDAADDEQTRT